MEKTQAIRGLPGEIELLARMHILYGLYPGPAFERQKETIRRIVSENRIPD